MQGPMRSGILETYIYTLAYSATPVRTVLYCFFVLRSVLLEETNITQAVMRTPFYYSGFTEIWLHKSVYVLRYYL